MGELALTRGRVEVAGSMLATATWGDGPVGIVMLHDGLGSISQWRDVPARVAEATGVAVLAYERAGHGSSTPVPTGAWPADWLHREARVFSELVDRLGIDEPFVVGHSDGASIALIDAAERPGTTRGLLAIAPHSWVERICFDSIVAMRANASRIAVALAPHHDAPGAVFEAWSGVWVSDEFRRWDIRPTLSAITVATLVVQGVDDAYATEDQAQATAAAIGANAECRLLPGIGHIAHHDDPDAIVALIADTYQSL